MKKNLLLTIFAFCFITFGFSQADCATALTLTPGTPQAGDTTGNAGSLGNTNTSDNSCSGNYNDDEYWFEYTAVNTGETLELTASDITSNWYGLFIFDACPDGTGAQGCIASDTNTSSSADLTFITPALTAGTTYKIVMSDWAEGSTTFTLNSTVISAPTCLEPTNLDVTVLTGDTTATVSWDAEAGATAGYNWVVMTDGEDPAVDAPVSMGTTAGGVTMDTATGLTAATNYDFYVQSNCDANGLSSWAGPVDFYSQAPPSNDECSAAIALTVNADLACGVTTAGSNAAATESPEMETSGAVTGTPFTDVWYNFVATSNSHTISLTNVVAAIGTSTDMGMALYDATTGCGATLAAPFDDSDPNAFTPTGLTIGTTYLLRVYGWSNTQSSSAQTNFDICIGTPPLPPANDDCANAAVLTESTDVSCANAVSGTTLSATPSADGCNTTNNDVWYTFVPTQTVDYNILVTETFDSASSSTYVSVYTGDCGALTISPSDTGCFDTGQTHALTAGTTYYVMVRSTSTSGYVDFDLCVYPTPAPPENDDCASASVLTESPDASCANAVSGTTLSATPSADGCNTTNNDVWYTFAPTQTADYFVSVTETFDSASSSTYVSVYTGDCGALTISPSDTGCFDTNQIHALTAGTTYYVMVRSTSTSGYVDFDLCAYPITVPANDACEDAITINDGDSIMGSTVGATNVEALTPCEDGTVGTTCDPGGDSTPNAGTLVFGTGVWYVYNSPGNESISIEDSAGAFDSEIQVFSGACGSLVCVAGDDDSSNVGSGGFVCFDATTATDYYIYVDGNAATGVGAYTLNLNTTPLAPANDECAAAEAITVGILATGDTTNATDSGVTGGTCPSVGGDQDIWYSFTADTLMATEGAIFVTTADHIVLYDDCAALLANEIACLTDGVNSPALIDGATYYARVYNTGIAKVAGPVALTLTSGSLSTTDFENGLAFSYYPNPVNNTLTLNAQQAITNVAVFNMLGQEVIRTAPNAVSNVVDMANLQSGAYFVQVTVGTAVETVRIIKN